MILSRSSDEFMIRQIDEQSVPGVTYKDLLDQLIQLKVELEVFFDNQEISVIEQVLTSWINYVAPGKLTPALVTTIREVAIVLDEWSKFESLSEEGK